MSFVFITQFYKSTMLADALEFLFFKSNIMKDNHIGIII